MKRVLDLKTERAIKNQERFNQVREQFRQNDRLDSLDALTHVDHVRALSMRKQVTLELGNYNDRNDGFDRSSFSRSKRNHSRISKQNKIARVKPEHKMLPSVTRPSTLTKIPSHLCKL